MNDSTAPLTILRCPKGGLIGDVHRHDHGRVLSVVELAMPDLDHGDRYISEAQAGLSGDRSSRSNPRHQQNLDATDSLSSATFRARCGCGLDVLLDPRSIRAAVDAGTRKVTVQHVHK